MSVGEFGEAVGQGARCLEHSRSVKRNISGVSYASESRTIAGCYTMLCKTDGTMSILIDGGHCMPHHACIFMKQSFRGICQQFFI